MATEKQRRILDEARSTLRSSKGIHSSDSLDRDALATWSALKKAREEPDEPPPVPEPPPAPIDWPAYIGQRITAAIAAERQGTLESIGEFVAEMVDEARRESKSLVDEARRESKSLVDEARRASKNDFADEVRSLRIELSETAAVIGELKVALAELRLVQIAERSAGAVDMTNWPRPAKPAN
jgi:vacuolar-type H+-ATPase subunit H